MQKNAPSTLPDISKAGNVMPVLDVETYIRLLNLCTKLIEDNKGFLKHPNPKILGDFIATILTTVEEKIRGEVVEQLRKELTEQITEKLTTEAKKTGKTPITRTISKEKQITVPIIVPAPVIPQPIPNPPYNPHQPWKKTLKYPQIVIGDPVPKPSTTSDWYYEARNNNVQYQSIVDSAKPLTDLNSILDYDPKQQKWKQCVRAVL